MSKQVVITKQYHADGSAPTTGYAISPYSNRYNQAGNYVPALQGEVLPPVRSVPTVADPYAEHLPQQVQQVVRYEVTPESRARSMVLKVHQVTIFLAMLTGAGMFVLTEWSFWLWLLLASAEWIFVFIVLAIIDYREQPAALSRMTADRYLGMMEREQAARLNAMYGSDK